MNRTKTYKIESIVSTIPYKVQYVEVDKDFIVLAIQDHKVTEIKVKENV
jgi:hypothetical protein